MGWLISIALLLGVAFLKKFTFTGDAILIASALYAIAGSIGGAANIIANKLQRNKDEQ